MTRRSTFTDQSVTYGAIGATLAEDLLRYPPAGYRPAVDTVRLGSGRGRFERAANELMCWRLQEGAGLEVTDIAEGTGMHYAGIRYQDDGTPIREHEPPAEARFDADGRPCVAPGVTATIRRHGRFGPRAIPMLIVFVIDEPSKVGFGYGTTQIGAESGEESFILEHHDDDTVWLTIRSILATRGGLHALAAPRVRRHRRELTRAELRSLHPAGSA